jgi:hypothetical protein
MSDATSPLASVQCVDDSGQKLAMMPQLDMFSGFRNVGCIDLPSSCEAKRLRNDSFGAQVWGRAIGGPFPPRTGRLICVRHSTDKDIEKTISIADEVMSKWQIVTCLFSNQASIHKESSFSCTRNLCRLVLFNRWVYRSIDIFTIFICI